jgi:L-serine dehydratase
LGTVNFASMEQLSIFDIFKIGVGPSSSHTLGPWKAALAFRDALAAYTFNNISITLYGSLSKTGKGHKTDVAIQLGLAGLTPETTNPGEMERVLDQIKITETLFFDSGSISFSPQMHIDFCNSLHEAHPNVLTFRATKKEETILEQTYTSLGGGFIRLLGDSEPEKKKVDLPFPIENGADVLRYTQDNSLDFYAIVFQNEQHIRTAKQIDFKLLEIYDTMKLSVYKGCITAGVLPGGLNVKRRARELCSKLLEEHQYKTLDAWEEALRKTPLVFDTLNTWISCFALAVNEQNAAMGKIVTSPTNGAAGVIPAVLLYHQYFAENKGFEDVKKFLLVAGEIGCMFKKGATISAAEGGCQAEIGVSSAMAAGGLTACLGGSTMQTLMAAEIAMEHHLGLTCDPIHGLVQVPCIERNSMGAIKAIMASNLALNGNPEDAIVNFDQVVKTMWETGLAMNSNFKETSEGGLAINVAVSFPSC